MLKTDPKTRGHELLAQKCLGCHRYGDETQAGKDAAFRAPNLAHFGSRAWLRGLLDNPSDPSYAARVPKAPGSKEGTEKPLSGMKKWKELYDLEPDERQKVVEFVGTFARIPADVEVDDWAADPKVKAHPGYEIFVENCCRCHAVGKLGTDDKELRAPGLFAWGSPQWTARMIAHPGSKSLYGFLKPHEQMPAFGSDQLTKNDLEMIVRFLEDDFVGAVHPTDKGQVQSLD